MAISESLKKQINSGETNFTLADIAEVAGKTAEQLQTEAAADKEVLDGKLTDGEVADINEKLALTVSSGTQKFIEKYGEKMKLATKEQMDAFGAVYAQAVIDYGWARIVEK